MGRAVACDSRGPGLDPSFIQLFFLFSWASGCTREMEPEVKNGTFLFLVFSNKMKNKSSSEIYWRATQGLEQETSP